MHAVNRFNIAASIKISIADGKRDNSEEECKRWKVVSKRRGVDERKMDYSYTFNTSIFSPL